VLLEEIRFLVRRRDGDVGEWAIAKFSKFLAVARCPFGMLVNTILYGSIWLRQRFAPDHPLFIPSWPIIFNDVI
jgi:hypothetical protein